LAEARFRHYPSPIGRTDPYLFGKKEVLNRLYFVRKHPELSPAACVFALGVRASISVFWGVTRLEGAHFRRVLGNFAAAFAILIRGPGSVA